MEDKQNKKTKQNTTIVLVNNNDSLIKIHIKDYQGLEFKVPYSSVGEVIFLSTLHPYATQVIFHEPLCICQIDSEYDNLLAISKVRQIFKSTKSLSSSYYNLRYENVMKCDIDFSLPFFLIIFIIIKFIIHLLNLK